MNESPYIHNFGEVFHALRVNSPESYFNFKQKVLATEPTLNFPSVINQETLFNRYLEFLISMIEKENFLIDIKYNSWHHFDTFWRGPLEPPFALQIAKKKELRIIHVVRKNVFRQYLSSQIAIQRAKWHYQEGEQIDELEDGIKLNVEHCKRAMELSRQHSNLFSNWLESYPHVKELVYEDFFQNGVFTDFVLSEINDLFGQELGLSKVPGLKKTSSEAKKMVLNRDEVLFYFSGTEFASLVEASLA